jgi:YbbR domain-containing protein
VRRIVRIVVHNWPLKVAAVLLATLLYVAVVVSQDAQDWQGRIPIEPRNQPAEAVLLSNLGFVEQIRFFAPPDVASRVSTSSFVAWVDLADVPVGTITFAPVRVEAADPQIQILGYEPSSVRIELDPVESKLIQVQVDYGDVPPGLSIQQPVVTPPDVTITGAASSVRQVTAALARVIIQPSGIDVDQLVPLVAVDAVGDLVRQVDISPSSARITISVISQLESRSLPVAPAVTGAPATGYTVSSVLTTPAVVTVEGDADVLAPLTAIATEPISIDGVTASITQTVALAPPDGVTILGTPSVSVKIDVQATQATRTFTAGVVLSGASPDNTYAISPEQVLVTLGGTEASLTTIDARTFTVTADVNGLAPGSYEVSVRVTVPADIVVVSTSPPAVTVTVTAIPTSSPVSVPIPTPNPSPVP